MLETSEIQQSEVFCMMNEFVKTNHLRGSLSYQEPMAAHTSWRVGGPADKFYVPADSDDLAEFLSGLDEDEPLTWLGLGSNLLVRDGGIRGTVIALNGVLNELSLSGGTEIRAGAGVACAKVARFAAREDLTGIEFFAGIPGTVGGALAMNAGAFGTETWERVKQVEVINRSGKRALRTHADFDIAYRSVRPAREEWFLEATLTLLPDSEGQGQETIRQLLAKRGASQPMGESSCGSVFRNPRGDYAGRLIEVCGLKGFSIGQARVSEKHANFIINEGGASAQDIENLILHLQHVVKEQQGVQLESEVRIVGEVKQ